MSLHSASVCCRVFAVVWTGLVTGMCASVSSGLRTVGLVPFCYLLSESQDNAELFVQTECSDQSVVIPVLTHQAHMGT